MRSLHSADGVAEKPLPLPRLTPYDRLPLLPDNKSPYSEHWTNSVALCAAMKAEPQEDVVEWLRYYQWLGVDHVYLTDNGSENAEELFAALRAAFPDKGWLTLRHELEPYSQMKVRGLGGGRLTSALAARLLATRIGHRGVVATACDCTPVMMYMLACCGSYHDGRWFVLPWLFPSSCLWPQIYRWCVHEHRQDWNWMMFLDLDEFVVLRHGVATGRTEVATGGTGARASNAPCLRAFLDRYRHTAAVVMHWIMVGPSGKETRPVGGGVLRHYTQCITRIDERFKTVANTYWIDGVGRHPHNMWYRCEQRLYEIQNTDRNLMTDRCQLETRVGISSFTDMLAQQHPS
jgi:hypothetical protein